MLLVVDDEPDVEALFRQQFRRDLRAHHLAMEFATSAMDALALVTGTTEHLPILIFSDVAGLEVLHRVKAMHPEAQ